jgi:hypothetical protein
MASSEGTWFNRLIRRRITAKLQHPRWGKTQSSSGFTYITVISLEAAERLPEIIQVARETMAIARQPWGCCLFVDLAAEWERDDETDPELRAALREQRWQQQAIDEHLGWLEQEREKKEFLERQHRLRLIEQEGRSVNPDDFAAPDTVPARTEECESKPIENDATADGDVLVVDRESDESEVDDEPSQHLLAQALDITSIITAEAYYVSDSGRAAAIHLMGREPAPI